MTTATETNAENLAMLKAMLSEYDIHLMIDSSGSMGGPQKAGQTRWAAAKELAFQISHAASEIDTDGIGLVTFGNGAAKVYENVTPGQIDDVFKAGPGGGTPLLQGLLAAFKLAGGSPKKDLVVCLTDGEPDGGTKNAIADAIKAQANSQESDDDLTLCFIQLGDDPAATKFLKSLDDDLKGAKFDIVDAITADEVARAPSIAHVLQAAING